VRYAEIFFDPQAHTSRGVSFDTVIRGLRRAILDARRLLDVRAQLIMCFLRDFSAEYAMATLLESLPYREWIVGVGLDSDERGNPPVKFAAVFARARAEGYQLTMHCDVDQEDSVEHIRQCLDVIGVDRIDHGVNCLESEDLQAEIKKRGLGLTVCPVSNSFVRGSAWQDAVRQLLDRGLRVTWPNWIATPPVPEPAFPSDARPGGEHRLPAVARAQHRRQPSRRRRMGSDQGRHTRDTVLQSNKGETHRR
jgi:adenosine deaminase